MVGETTTDQDTGRVATLEGMEARLTGCIIAEQLALAEEMRRMSEAAGDATWYQTARALAHLHRTTLRALLTVRDGGARPNRIPREESRDE